MMKEQEPVDWRLVRRFLNFSVSVVFLLLALFYVYQALLLPFGASCFLCYILIPWVDRLDRSRIPRGLIILLTLCLILALICVASFNILPFLYSGLFDLIKRIPAMLEYVNHNLIPAIREQVLSFGFVDDEEFTQFVAEISSISQLTEKAQEALRTVWYTVPRVLGTVLNLIMIPFFTFFLLRDFSKLKKQIVKVIPLDLREPLIIFWSRVNKTLRKVLSGQVIVAAILGFLYMVGLSITGLHNALLIGFIAGICRLVPYADVVIGGGLSLIVILSDYQGSGQLISVSLVFLVVQFLDGMLITPKILGGRAGLHPVLIIVSVIAFGQLFGFWGVLLAVPIIAFTKVFILSIAPFYFLSDVFKPRK